MNNWFEIENADELLSPALLFYPDRIQQNIDQMIALAGDASRLRPHIKTYKCREIIEMQLLAGISKFKCATLAEATLLTDVGVKDILVAYPLVGPSQKKFLELVGNYPEIQFSALVDHPAQLVQWGENAQKPVSIFVDVNVGMNRTGADTTGAEQLLAIAAKGKFTILGLHAYDGHIRESDTLERKRLCDEGFLIMEKLLTQVKKVNPNPELVCGGSVTFPIHALYRDRILSPGTTLLWDEGYGSNFPDLPFVKAACLLTRVISTPGINKLCLDLGHKAVASEMKVAPVYFPQLPDAKITVHSEEHLVVESSSASKWNVGDALYGFPWHICPTVALHQKAAIVSNGIVNDFWTISARERLYAL